ncbi:substrate-binding periplasmic protein [Aestuariibacter salexigens]|uniref:substrate-binding periplasmic protein n=1 Tax=Aestuariibacter salexigens TaxID=226010 RepID=UPI0003F99865|nr:transporter substrate-binding domain-containing protein [Aestuariibacter salexigens]
MPVVAQQSDLQIYLYTYHKKPPFVVNEERQEGLYYDMAKLLTRKTDNAVFRTIFLPRKRLDLMLKERTLDGVVVGVNPKWFKDPDETRYLWLPTMFTDRDEFVSLKSSPFEFTGIESLYGKSFAGVLGFYYFGVNEAVAEERVPRIDTIGERQVLELIEKGRADVGIVSQSVFAYLQRKDELPDIYHLSERPHDEFARRAFTLKRHQDLYQVMLEATETLKDDPAWQQLLAKYR